MAQPKAFPQKGFNYYTTGTQTGNWYAIQVLEEASLDTEGSNQDDLSAVTVPTGAFIYGDFTSITINSGRIIAYKS